MTVIFTQHLTRVIVISILVIVITLEFSICTLPP